MDQKTQQQVWQRVLGQPEPPREDLRALELQALEAAAVYRKLSEQLPGRSRQVLGRLYDIQSEIIACLKGIGQLSGCRGEKLPQIAAPKEPMGKALEKRYHCARRAAAEYTARTMDGELGIVYAHLADRSREQCILLARLLGQLPVPGEVGSR